MRRGWGPAAAPGISLRVAAVAPRSAHARVLIGRARGAWCMQCAMLASRCCTPHDTGARQASAHRPMGVLIHSMGVPIHPLGGRRRRPRHVSAPASIVLAAHTRHRGTPITHATTRATPRAASASRVPSNSVGTVGSSTLHALPSTRLFHPDPVITDSIITPLASLLPRLGCTARARTRMPESRFEIASGHANRYPVAVRHSSDPPLQTFPPTPRPGGKHSRTALMIIKQHHTTKFTADAASSHAATGLPCLRHEHGSCCGAASALVPDSRSAKGLVGVPLNKVV
jgi:hypothetical protein